MRLIVNIILAALTAAGPWVCCCTTAALSRATAKWSRVAGANKRQPARTCCHHVPPRKSTGDRPTDKQAPKGTSARHHGPHDPAPQNRTCPCRDQREEPVAVKVSDETRLTPGSRDFAPPSEVLLSPVQSPGCPGGSPCAAAPPGSLLPFMSTDERLYAHHVLRC